MSMKKWAYYNDSDPFVCQWTRNLIGAGLIMDGDVDCRPIQEVQADDLKGYVQCHFFNGISGWPYALQLAGWSGPVWTGSCPCQPLSSAGQRKGAADSRHLWPAFFELIAKCGPPVVFGEQVGSRDGLEWLAGIRTDLEGVGYACGAVDLPAAGVGAPHIRQRLFWVAHRQGERFQEGRGFATGESQRTVLCSDTSRLAQPIGGETHAAATGGLHAEPGECGAVDYPIGSIGHECGHRMRCDHQCGLAPGCCGGSCCEFPNECTGQWGECVAIGMGNATVNGSGTCNGQSGEGNRQQEPAGGSGIPDGLGNAVSEGLEGYHGDGNRGREPGRFNPQQIGPIAAAGWANLEWLACADGKARPTGKRIYWMVNGLSCRMVSNGTKEVIDATTTDTMPDQAVQGVRRGPAAEAVPDEAVGGQGGISAEGVLQSGLHDGMDGRADQSDEPEELPPSVSKGEGLILRNVQRNGELARSPQGRESAEQHPVEPSDVMRLLSSTLAHDGWERRLEGCGALPNLLAAFQEIGVLPEALSEIPALWQSIPYEAQNRVCVCLVQRGARWHIIHPLSNDEGKGRVGQLHAYGNAIVPQVAAEFVKAFMDVR